MKLQCVQDIFGVCFRMHCVVYQYKEVWLCVGWHHYRRESNWHEIFCAQIGMYMDSISLNGLCIHYVATWLSLVCITRSLLFNSCQAMCHIMLLNHLWFMILRVTQYLELYHAIKFYLEHKFSSTQVILDPITIKHLCRQSLKSP